MPETQAEMDGCADDTAEKDLENQGQSRARNKFILRHFHGEWPVTQVFNSTFIRRDDIGDLGPEQGQRKQ